MKVTECFRPQQRQMIIERVEDQDVWAEEIPVYSLQACRYSPACDTPAVRKLGVPNAPRGNGNCRGDGEVGRDGAGEFVVLVLG